MNLTMRIKEIIKKYFKEGRADKLNTLGIAEIKMLIKRQGGAWKRYKEIVKKSVKQIEKELYEEFEKERLTGIKAQSKQELHKIISGFESTLNERQTNIQNIIKKALAESEITKEKWEVVTDRGLRKIKLEERHIRTEIETAKASLNNIQRFNNFEKGSVKYLRYEGPATVRPFCIDHIGKVYSFDEVSKMVNHFGQPAYAYCGGYNCRHRWVPVVGEGIEPTP